MSDDLIRREDVLAILDSWIAGNEESARLKIADDLPGSATEHQGSAAIARCIAAKVRSLPADPVAAAERELAEAAIAFAEVEDRLDRIMDGGEDGDVLDVLPERTAALARFRAAKEAAR